MMMRRLINLVEAAMGDHGGKTLDHAMTVHDLAAHRIYEGKSLVLGDTGRRVIQSPSRSDILQMLKNSAMLRGTAIALADAKDFDAFVWPGRSFSHWTVLNELQKLGYFSAESGNFETSRMFDFKLAVTAEKIREDRYWRSAEIYDCGGYHVAFGTFVTKGDRPQQLEWIIDSPYLRRLFPINTRQS